MQQRLSILAAAAALTVSGMGFSYTFAQTGGGTAGSSGSSSAGQSQQDTSGGASGSSSTSSGGLSGAAGSMTAGRGQQSPDAKDISKTISQLTSAAVQGKFDDVAERLSDNDRRRLKDQFAQKDDQVATRWEQFKNDWRAKYNQEFDSSNAVTALDQGGQIQILNGDFSAAQLAGQRMSPSGSAGAGTDISGSAGTASGRSGSSSDASGAGAGASSGTSGAGVSGSAGAGGVSGSANVGGAGVSGGASAGNGGVGASGSAGTSGSSAGTAGGTGATGSAGGTGATGGATIGGTGANAAANGNVSGSSRDAGTGIAAGDQTSKVNKNMATVVIPASHGLPPVALHVTNEGTLADKWKVDVPDTIDGQTLKSNLERQLAQVGDKNSWPNDVNDAYRYVTHAVLASFSDQQAMQNGMNNMRNDTGGRTRGTSGSPTGAGSDRSGTGTGASGSGSTGSSGSNPPGQ